MSCGPFVISLYLNHFHPIHQWFIAFKTTITTINKYIHIYIYIYILATRTQNHTLHITHFLLLKNQSKMASSPPTYNNGHPQILPNEEEPPHSTLVFRPAGWRTPSFSSSSPSSSWDSSLGSSSFSFNEEFPPSSPISSPLKSKGVPFSWEQIPGIPKHQGSKKKNSSDHLLPLPPAGTTTATSSSTTKKPHHQDEISPKKSNRFQRDPFFAALVECCKDDNDNDDGDHHGSNDGNILKGSSKITRTLSDRFGFINIYTSCKRTSAVSESIVYRPRQSSHYLLNRRSS